MAIQTISLILTEETVSDNRLYRVGTKVGYFRDGDNFATSAREIRPAELAKWIASGRITTEPTRDLRLCEVRWSKDHSFAPFAPEPPALVDDFREVDKAIVDVEGQA